MSKGNFGLYWGRATRHFVKLTLLMALIFGLMVATNTLAVGPRQLLGYRGIILLVAMVGISLAYPNYGFVTIGFQASIVGNREQIVAAMSRCGYTLHSEEQGVLTFRAAGVWKRLVNMGDDALVLRQVDATTVELSGVRKEVENARFRIVGEINRGF